MRKRLGLLFAIALPVALSLAAQEKKVTALERDAGLYATLETSMGKIVVQLFEKEAPKTIENFVGLATGKKAWTHPGTGQRKVNNPYFDGVIFHRVIPKFMIQTGDPLGIGVGGPGYTIPDEFSPKLKFDRPGRLGMANIGQPNTGGAQFFITHVATPHLSNRHTIFGQVIEGQEIVTAIGNVPRDARDKPLKPVTILKVTIERVEAPPEP